MKFNDQTLRVHQENSETHNCVEYLLHTFISAITLYSMQLTLLLLILSKSYVESRILGKLMCNLEINGMMLQLITSIIYKLKH